jgi:hypothetical protein
MPWRNRTQPALESTVGDRRWHALARGVGLDGLQAGLEIGPLSV